MFPEHPLFRASALSSRGCRPTTSSNMGPSLGPSAPPTTPVPAGTLRFGFLSFCCQILSEPTVESILLCRLNYTSEKAASLCGYVVYLLRRACEQLRRVCGQPNRTVIESPEIQRNILKFIQFSNLQQFHAESPGIPTIRCCGFLETATRR